MVHNMDFFVKYPWLSFSEDEDVVCLMSINKFEIVLGIVQVAATECWLSNIFSSVLIVLQYTLPAGYVQQSLCHDSVKNSK